MNNTQSVDSVCNPIMELISRDEMQKLLAAGYDGSRPIVKLFVANLTWLVTGIEDGILYGFADLGMDCVEWGSLIGIDELPTFRVGPFYLEKDLYFEDDPSVNYFEVDTLVGI